MYAFHDTLNVTNLSQHVNETVMDESEVECLLEVNDDDVDMVP